MKFSIIVPAYNVAQYIEECVESVLNQDYDNYEVIVVDDGATDETPQIIDNLAKKSEKVIALHKENGGASSARNQGIQVSSGDYVLFLDGDDFWTSKSFLSSLEVVLTTNEKDVIIFPYTELYDEKKLTYHYSKCSGNYIEDAASGLFNGPNWNKCIKKSCIDNNQLLFDTSLIAEDCIWGANLLKVIDSYEIVDNPQYMYRQNRAGSLTNVVKEKNVFDILKSISIGLDNLEKFPSEKQEALKIYFAISYISILPFVHLYKSNFDIKNYLTNYEYLLQYSKQIKNKTFKYTGLVAKGIGVEKAAVLFNKLLGLYKKFKKLGIIKS
ncbi:Glycosyltransferase involved in cell wall bisynthesis [Streptococcus equinus]|nr:Glycosyltransferase involved in cell wall bisynthesis [Streptococcus equinus]